MTQSQKMSRRNFVASGLAAASAASLSFSSKHLQGREISGQNFTEKERFVPVQGKSDVIVCGGGPAGVCAAISAARAGANVQLFESHGSLGGTWTSGLLTYIFDMNKSDLGFEIIRRLDAVNARRCESKQNFVYEPEYMKYILEQMCLESGVKFRLLTNVVAAPTKDRKIKAIITESKSGREAWIAPVIIDTTGDGDVGALSGCAYDTGSSEDGAEQPLTLNALAVVRDWKQITKFISNVPQMWGPGGHVSSSKAFKNELKRAGFTASYDWPTLFQCHENLILVMINHQFNVKVDNAQAMSDATVQARSEIIRLTDALRKLGGPWEGIRIAASAEQIGIRTGRRIHGYYSITAEDTALGTRHDDAVTLSRFGIDIHEMKGSKGVVRPRQFKHFEIPVRSLIAKDVDNLMMAGRCISGQFVPLSSYRVTGSAVAMGEAAGKVAAQAAKEKIKPIEVPWKRPVYPVK